MFSNAEHFFFLDSLRLLYNTRSSFKSLKSKDRISCAPLNHFFLIGNDLLTNRAMLFVNGTIKTAFTRCRHILKTVKNVTDRPPAHTKTVDFLPADFENGRF